MHGPASFPDGAAQPPTPAEFLSGSAGAPLDARTRTEMEARFGQPLRDVRVHTGAAAARSADAENADAYTLGGDIVFGRGAYAPETDSGRRLLGHELTHVLQQRRGGSSGQPPDGRHEAEADRAAGAPRGGRVAPVSGAPLRVQRKEKRDEPIQPTDVPDSSMYAEFSSAWAPPTAPTREYIKTKLVGLDLIDRETVDKCELKLTGNPKLPSELIVTHPELGDLFRLAVVRFNLSNGRKVAGIEGVRIGGGSGKGDGGGSKPITTPDPNRKADAPSTGTTGSDKKGPPQGTAPQGDGSAEEQADPDKLLKENPYWQQLSPADRKLLLEYSKLTPDETGGKPIDRVTTDVKLSMALKLSSSWPEEVLEAAKASFSDPVFVIMLVVTLAIYVGLWLVPEPTFITKVAAGVLTAVLLLQFAWEDIYGLAKAWFTLTDKCKAATTVAELKAAGDEFSRKVGSVGFDILLFIATWGLGKAVGPKVGKVGAARNTARARGGVSAAETKVATAESKPGSGVVKNAPGEGAKMLDAAKSNAKGTTASAVLDALAETLPKGAREGLAKFRVQMRGDMEALRALEGRAKAGQDLTSFLTDKGASAETQQAVRGEIDAAKADLAKAKIKLARAELIESRGIADPALREAARTKIFRAIRSLLKDLGALDTPEMQKALQSRDPLRMLGALRKLLRAMSEPSVTETQGAVGEAIFRSQIEAKYAKRPNVKVHNNLAIVRRVPGYKTITEWRNAESARLTEQKVDKELIEKQLSRDAAKYLEANGALYESLGEIDMLVTEGTGKGKMRPIEAVEVKTGGKKKAAIAAEQLGSAVNWLKAIGQGQDARVFQMEGKNTLGADVTETFDLSSVDAVEKTTVGPSGRGFGVELELTDGELEGLAKSLIEDMPPAQPQTIPPTSLPRDEDKKQK